MNFEDILNFLCSLIKENSVKISVISAMASIISAVASWKQAKIAKRKIRVELYQTRINIYITISKAYRKIIGGGQFESDAVDEINTILSDLSDRVYESELLFHGDEILVDEIKYIHDDLFFVFRNKIKGQNEYLEGEELYKNGQEVSNRVIRIEERMKIIKNLMVKYISFNDQ